MAKKIAKPAPKPAPKPAAKPAAKPAPKPAEKNLKPRAVPFQAPQPAPLDLVRNPNFDAAMAQQNYANLMRDQQARIDAERGTPSADPTAQPYVFDKSKQRAGKEILLSFAGGQYGSVNDEAADAIAKKYNLDIVNKPNPNKDEGPKIYRFSVKGDVDKGLSGIKNEPGVRYAQPNSRSFIPERGPDPFVTYEDNRMRAALNGEELPTPPVGYIEGFDKSKNLTPPAEIGGDFRAPQRPPQGPQVGGGTQQPREPGQFGDDQLGKGVLSDEDKKRIYDDLMAKIRPQLPPQRPQEGGGIGGQGNFPADVAQSQYIDPQSPEGQAMGKMRQMARYALSKYNPNMPSLMPIPQAQKSFGDVARTLPPPQPFDPNAPSLMPIYNPGPNPQAQQMPVPDQQQGARADQYKNFLQQGLANYAAQNYPQQQQGAMGAQAAQNYAGGPMPSPAIPSPQLGGASAQPRGVPRPRQPKGFGSPIGRSAF